MNQCDRVQEAYLGCSQHTFGFGILAVRLPHTQQSQGNQIELAPSAGPQKAHGGSTLIRPSLARRRGVVLRGHVHWLLHNDHRGGLLR